MTAVLIPTASEAEWLAERRKGITASEIAVLMGLSPYGSPFSLYYRKLGQLSEPEDNDAMALGRHMESYVADRFAERHPEFAVYGDGRTLYAHRERRWEMATPDRLITEGPVLADYQCCELHRPGYASPGGMAPCCDTNDCGPCCDDCPTCPTANGIRLAAVLECKVDGGSDGWGDDGSDEIPVHYRCQVLWQMNVLGVATGYLACLLWQRRQVRVYELTRDHAAEMDLLVMRGEAVRFLERIDRGDPPDVDWRPATSDALRRLHPSLTDSAAVIPVKLAGQYRAACKALNAARARKTLAENKIRERMQASRYAVTGHGPGTPDDLVATRQVYDVKEHVRKASRVDKLVAARPPKESTP